MINQLGVVCHWPHGNVTITGALQKAFVLLTISMGSIKNENTRTLEDSPQSVQLCEYLNCFPISDHR